MNANESVSSINQVVDEFPAPPEYYKNTALVKTLLPPAIPEGDSYTTAYGGIFAAATQNRSKFDPSKDYCALLKQ